MRHQEAPLLNSSPGKHHALFPLPLSILAGTNLIMLLIFLFNPSLLPKKIHPPFDFRENSSSFDFREKSIKTPKENQKKKKCFYFVAPCVFWIYSRVLFAFVPLDLNSTNPKSTIFEPRWKPQHLPSNCGSVCVYGLVSGVQIHYFFKLIAFVPFDLNSTNPKSMIFEPRWKPQPLPSNCGSVCVCGLD